MSTAFVNVLQKQSCDNSEVGLAILRRNPKEFLRRRTPESNKQSVE